MCFFEIESDQEQDSEFITRKAFINENRNNYNDIKNYIKFFDPQNDKETHNTVLFFEQLFLVYNIANVFGEITLKNHVISIINGKVITKEKVCLLLKEYVRIYENFIIQKLL